MRWEIILTSVLTVIFNQVFITSAQRLVRGRRCIAADVAFVLDTSSSIWEKDFKKQLEFVDEVVSGVNIGSAIDDTRVGIITYADGVWLKFNMNQNMELDALKKAIHRIRHRAGQRTDTGDAIKYMRLNMFEPYRGARDGVVDVGIVITDGQSQDYNLTLTEAANARKAGIEMYAIGVGDKIKYSELQGIASDPDNQYVYTVEGYDTLINKKDFFAQQHCKAPTTPVPPVTQRRTPRPWTWPPRPTTTPRPATPRPTRRPIIIRPRPIPRVIPIQSCAGKPADIFFLMDASASIGDSNFNIQKQFVKNLIGRFDISHENMRVGVVTFSNSYDINVPLGSEHSVNRLHRAIDRIPYSYGMTNTADAIRYVRQYGFAGVNRRDRVAQIAIVLTDGLSRDPARTRREAQLARDAGVHLFAIGIGEAVYRQELRDIANDPDDKYVFHVSNFRALNSIRDILAERTCDVSPLVKLCGSHDLSDIMFLYDALSIGPNNTNILTKFVARVVQNFDTRTGNVRIGRTLYECLDDAHYALSSPGDLNSWSNVVLPGIVDLLKKLRRTGFSSDRGGRAAAKSIAVLFVDHNLHNMRDVQSHMNMMSNVQFITVIVGANPHEIRLRASGSNIILTVPSYQDLYNFRDTFLTYICPAIGRVS